MASEKREQGGRAGFDPAPFLARIEAGAEGCGRIDMRIARDGGWWHEGVRIGRIELVRLFASILHRVGDGYWLVTPAEQMRIEVEDVPFTAVELESRGEGRARQLRLRTNLDQWVPVDAEHPLAFRPDPAGEGMIPYLMVRDGLEARLLRPVFYELVELAEPDGPGAAGDEDGDGDVGLWSGGIWIGLGSVED